MPEFTHSPKLISRDGNRVCIEFNQWDVKRLITALKFGGSSDSAVIIQSLEIILRPDVSDWMDWKPDRGSEVMVCDYCYNSIQAQTLFMISMKGIVLHMKCFERLVEEYWND